MLSFGPRTVAAHQSLQSKGIAEATRPRILAITADVGFYSSVLTAACGLGWSADWVTTMTRGLEICAYERVNIVIYDRNLPRTDWRGAFDRLTATAAGARIILATPFIDEDLWRMVLRRRGYDVLVRSAGSEQLRRELRFAWLSLQESSVPVRNNPTWASLP